MAAGKEFQLKTVLSLRDQLSKPLAGIRKEFQKLDKSVKHVGSEAKKLGSAIGKPLAMLTGGAMAGIGAAVHTFSTLGDSIDKAAQRAGVGVVELQKLQYAAGLGGSSAEEMEHALIKLGQQMNEVSTGGAKEFSALMQHLGIPLKDANGKMRSSSDIMRNLAEAMKNNKDNAARLQIATIAFGKSGAGLIPVLSGGADSLDEMGKRAEDLGLILDEKSVKAAADFNDKMGELKRLGQVAAAKIGGALAPAFEELIPAIEGVIKDNLPAFIEGIKEAIRFVGDIVESVGGFKNILMIAGAIIGGSFIGKLVGLVGSVIQVGKALWGLGKVFAIFSASNPVVLAIMAIVGAIGALIAYKDEIFGFFKGLWEKLSGAGAAIMNFLSGGSLKAPRLNGEAVSMAGAQNSLAVTVAAEKGTSARVTRTSSDGGSMTVDYGVTD